MSLKKSIIEFVKTIESGLSENDFKKSFLSIYPNYENSSTFGYWFKRYAIENGYVFKINNTKIQNKQNEEYSLIDLNSKSITLEDITEDDIKTYKTNTAFDTIASDMCGLMGGTQYEVSAAAGTGKTTLLTQIGVYLQENNPSVDMMFISAEMNEQDWKVEIYKNKSLSGVRTLFISEIEDESNIKNVIYSALRSAKYVIVDSVTVLGVMLSDYTGMKPEKAKKWICKQIIKASQENNSIMMCIKHATKDGSVVGTTWDKHMFTGQLLLEAETATKRYAYFTKNRRGSSQQFKKLYFFRDKETGRLMFDQSLLDQQTMIDEIKTETENKLKEDELEFDKMFETESDNDSANESNVYDLTDMFQPELEEVNY